VKRPIHKVTKEQISAKGYYIGPDLSDYFGHIEFDPLLMIVHIRGNLKAAGHILAGEGTAIVCGGDINAATISARLGLESKGAITTVGSIGVADGVLHAGGDIVSKLSWIAASKSILSRRGGIRAKEGVSSDKEGISARSDIICEEGTIMARGDIQSTRGKVHGAGGVVSHESGIIAEMGVFSDGSITAKADIKSTKSAIRAKGDVTSTQGSLWAKYGVSSTSGSVTAHLRVQGNSVTAKWDVTAMELKSPYVEAEGGMVTVADEAKPLRL